MSNFPRLSQPILTDEELKTIKKGTPLAYNDSYGNTYYGRFTGSHPKEKKLYGLYDSVLKSKDSNIYNDNSSFGMNWSGEPNMKNVTTVDYFGLNSKPSSFGLRKLENPIKEAKKDEIIRDTDKFARDIQHETDLEPPFYEGDEGGSEYIAAKKRFEEQASKTGGRRKKNKKTKRNKKHQSKTKSKRR